MFAFPELKFPHNAIPNFASEESLKRHHLEHKRYVDILNKMLDEKTRGEDIAVTLGKMSSVIESSRPIVRNYGGGHYNHNMFWSILTNKKTELKGSLLEAIKTSCGNVENFMRAFTQAAVSKFGSGWVWLTKHNNKLIVETTSNNDNPVMEWRQPIMCLDLWEHSYFPQTREEYVKNFWDVVDWDQVDKNYNSK